MRDTLLNWLVEVTNRFKLQDETLFIAINILDRYTSKMQIDMKMYQLVGITSLFIAVKIHEEETPVCEDYTFITDNAFTKSQLL